MGWQTLDCQQMRQWLTRGCGMGSVAGCKVTFAALGMPGQDSEGVLVLLLWQQEPFLGELQAGD